MERNTCHICGESRFSDFADLDHRHIVCCISCGYVFASRFSEAELANAYEKDYYASPEDPRIEGWIVKNVGVWEGLCNTLEKYAKEPKSLLDIGAGSGGFLLAYHKRNPLVSLSAVEMSDAARISLARRLPSINFPVKDVAQLLEVTEQYDVVTLLQTLEHVYDPKSLCKDIYDKLKPGGILLVTVPNIRSYKVLLHGTRDTHCFGNMTHL